MLPEFNRSAPALVCVFFSGFSNVAAQGGQALALDGSGDFVSVPSSPPLQNPAALTIEAWILPETLHNGRILSKGDGLSGDTARTYDLTYAWGHVRLEWFVTAASDGYVPLETSAVYSPLEWNHIAGVFDGAAGIASLYVNGDLVQSRTTTISGEALAGKALRQTSHPVNVGHTPPFDTTFFRGWIEEVRIWSVPRPQAEIQIARCLDLDAVPGLAAAWHFDGSFLDFTGGHNATPLGDAAFASYSEPRCAPSGPRVLRVPMDYATIQQALDDALGGDEILVAPGAYFERLRFPPKAVRLHSEDGPAATVIDGQALGGSVVHFLSGTSNASILEGFTLTGGLEAFGAGVQCDIGAQPSLIGNWIVGNHATYDGGGVFPRPENQLVIVGNRIAWNSAIGQAGGMQAPGTGSIVRYNVFIGNQAAHGGAYFIRRESSVVLENNTFYANSAPNGSVFAGDGSLTLVNSIVWGNPGPPLFLYDGGTLMARFSLVEGGADQPWFGTGCLDEDPRFVDPSMEDLRLRRTSPCIDSGDPASPLDPDGSRADMGALPRLPMSKVLLNGNQARPL